MYDFGFPIKLIRLVKICIKNILYLVSTSNTLSETFEVVMGLKQKDALSPILFNIALEKVTRKMQESLDEEIYVDSVNIKVLGFTDDLTV